jgi:UTP--glucose-1-phosphate uridylyltransferase
MKNIKPIRKAVIAAAGFGTRFLPQTKAMPKEMLPLVDKPVIQYVVEELVDAGIENIIIVTGYHKRSIEDHFDAPSSDLIENLKLGGEKKKPLLEEVERISNLASFAYVRQKGPYGNGTPLLNVKGLIGDEPFIYTWSDDIIAAEPNVYKQLIAGYNTYGASCISTIRVTKDEEYDRYGFAAGKLIQDGVISIEEVVEKPGKDKAPSDLGTVSSFLFTPEIIGYLEQAQGEMKPGSELYWNDGLSRMLADGHKAMALEIKNAKYFDCGNKLEYIKTIVQFGLKDAEVGPQFAKWLADL